jgi:hypothetical protein
VRESFGFLCIVSGVGFAVSWAQAARLGTWFLFSTLRLIAITSTFLGLLEMFFEKSIAEWLS